MRSVLKRIRRKMKTVFEIMKENDSERKMADFLVKQKMPYSFKRQYAAIRAHEFVRMCGEHDKNYHVSVGGLDSIVLFLFLHSIGIKCHGISVSSLEDASIQKVHKALGIERLSSAKKEDGKPWTMPQIVQEYGFPVISKEIAAKIELLQNPSEKNATVRHAIITGETGAYGGYQKNSRMKMPQKWLEKFAGYENENEGVNYQIAPFKCSSKCCYYLKEKPCDDYAKEHNSVPFLGLMASEGGRREKSLKLHGCNYWGKSTVRSAPFAIFMRQDLLMLALEMEEWYHEHWQEFGDTELETIIPKIYGKIDRRERSAEEINKLVEEHEGEHYPEFEYELFTTEAQRTGCPICGFGIHLEKRPHRFDRLRERNPKEWDFYMNRMCKDENGNDFGWGLVLDYIGVGWRDVVTEPPIVDQDESNKEESQNK